VNRFSANLGFLWADLPLLERIERSAKAGFKAIELHWPYENDPKSIKDLCAHLSLDLLALNTPLGSRKDDFGIAALKGRESEFQDSFYQAVEFARAAGAETLHVMAGSIERNAQSRETFMKNLVWAETAAPDMRLVLEPLNSYDKPGYFYHLPEHAVEMIRDADLRQTRLMLDAYHVGREGQDSIKIFDAFRQYIAHVQIASVPDRQEPDHGVVDYDAFLKHLTASGYRGWVGCEYTPASTPEAGMPALSALSQLVPR